MKINTTNLSTATLITLTTLESDCLTQHAAIQELLRRHNDPEAIGHLIGMAVQLPDREETISAGLVRADTHILIQACRKCERAGYLDHGHAIRNVLAEKSLYGDNLALDFLERNPESTAQSQRAASLIMGRIAEFIENYREGVDIVYVLEDGTEVIEQAGAAHLIEEEAPPTVDYTPRGTFEVDIHLDFEPEDAEESGIHDRPTLEVIVPQIPSRPPQQVITAA